MMDAAKTPNVVEACNKSGLYDTLEDTQKRYYIYTCVILYYYVYIQFFY